MEVLFTAVNQIQDLEVMFTTCFLKSSDLSTLCRIVSSYFSGAYPFGVLGSYSDKIGAPAKHGFLNL